MATARREEWEELRAIRMRRALRTLGVAAVVILLIVNLVIQVQIRNDARAAREAAENVHVPSDNYPNYSFELEEIRQHLRNAPWVTPEPPCTDPDECGPEVAPEPEIDNEERIRTP